MNLRLLSDTYVAHRRTVALKNHESQKGTHWESAPKLPGVAVTPSRREFFIRSYTTPDKKRGVVLNRLKKQRATGNSSGLHTPRYTMAKRCPVELTSPSGEVQTFESYAEAERQTGVPVQKICDMIKGRRISSSGWMARQIDG